MTTTAVTIGEFATRAPITIAAVVVALGVIWRKVVIPLREFVRRFKAWMARIEASTALVEEQMKPNSGSTLWDKIELANRERAEIHRSIDELRIDVRMLLKHDAERDVVGFRYGDQTTEEPE
jgi:hypothetical protein